MLLEWDVLVSICSGSLKRETPWPIWCLGIFMASSPSTADDRKSQNMGLGGTLQLVPMTLSHHSVKYYTNGKNQFTVGFGKMIGRHLKERNSMTALNT